MTYLAMISNPAKPHEAWQEIHLLEVGLPRYGRSVSGYGSKLATEFKTKLNGRLYRVYAMNFGNCPSFYIGGNWEKRIATVESIWKGEKK